LKNNLNQVYFNDKKKIKNWLSPSFLPIPMIASLVGDEEEF
jgi:hypothetical protein